MVLYGFAPAVIWVYLFSMPSKLFTVTILQDDFVGLVSLLLWSPGKPTACPRGYSIARKAPTREADHAHLGDVLLAVISYEHQISPIWNFLNIFL